MHSLNYVKTKWWSWTFKEDYLVGSRKNMIVAVRAWIWNWHHKSITQCSETPGSWYRRWIHCYWFFLQEGANIKLESWGLTGWPPCKPCATGETSLCNSTLHPTFNFNQLYSMYPTTPLSSRSHLQEQTTNPKKNISTHLILHSDPSFKTAFYKL